MKKNRSRHSGFTLAELLVATVLLSIVMGSVYTLFHSTIRSWRAVEGDVDFYQDARTSLTIFQRELDSIVPATAHLFEGEDNEITFFLTAEPMNVEDSEGAHLLRVRYYYSRPKKALIREEALVETALPRRPPDDRELDRQRIKLKKEEKFVLASNVDDLQFTYIWMPVPKDRDTEIPPTPIEPYELHRHKERWGLPQGVQLTMTFQDPEDRSKRLEISARMPIRSPSSRKPMSGPGSIEEMVGQLQ